MLRIKKEHIGKTFLKGRETIHLSEDLTQKQLKAISINMPDVLFEDVTEDVKASASIIQQVLDYINLEKKDKDVKTK